jgi:hypothetical protein
MSIQKSLVALLMAPLVVLNTDAQGQVLVDRIHPAIDPTGGNSSLSIEVVPPNKSAWIDTSPDDHYVYIATLRVATSMIGSILGHEPNMDDLLVLKDANDKLDHADERAMEYRERLCERFKTYEPDVSNEQLASYGDDFNSVDVLIAEDVYSLFEETLSRLTDETAKALIQIKESANSAPSRIDFRKYAELSPEEMREVIMDSCK